MTAAWSGTDEFQRLAMGRSTVGWARVMQEKLALDEPIDAIIAEMKARVVAHYEAHMPARPGALESVAHMKRHFRVGLASGSPTDIIKAVLRITGLDQIFEVMIYGDEVPRGKPAPDIYLEALKQLGVAPSRSLGIEDSANGLRSLKAAGMFAVAAPSPDYPLPDDVLALARRAYLHAGRFQHRARQRHRAEVELVAPASFLKYDK